MRSFSSGRSRRSSPGSSCSSGGSHIRTTGPAARGVAISAPERPKARPTQKGQDGLSVRGRRQWPRGSGARVPGHRGGNASHTSTTQPASPSSWGTGSGIHGYANDRIIHSAGRKTGTRRGHWQSTNMQTIRRDSKSARGDGSHHNGNTASSPSVSQDRRTSRISCSRTSASIPFTISDTRGPKAAP